jgi:hypothetical protein
MTWDQYVAAVSDLLSGDPDRMASANRRLFGMLVRGRDAEKLPALALVDAEQKAQGS